METGNHGAVAPAESRHRTVDRRAALARFGREICRRSGSAGLSGRPARRPVPRHQRATDRGSGAARGLRQAPAAHQSVRAQAAGGPRSSGRGARRIRILSVLRQPVRPGGVRQRPGRAGHPLPVDFRRRAAPRQRRLPGAGSGKAVGGSQRLAGAETRPANPHRQDRDPRAGRTSQR